MFSFIKKTAALTVIALTSSVAMAQDFPERPINLVAPFNAGGGTDLLLRAFAPHFAEALGGDAYVSNMAGGSGTVGAAALSGQRPDGYQIDSPGVHSDTATLQQARTTSCDATQGRPC